MAPGKGYIVSCADHSLTSWYVGGLLNRSVGPPERCVFFTVLGERQRNPSLKTNAVVDSTHHQLPKVGTPLTLHSRSAYVAVLHQMKYQLSAPDILFEVTTLMIRSPGSRPRQPHRSGGVGWVGRGSWPQTLVKSGLLCPFSLLHRNTRGPLAQASPTVH